MFERFSDRARRVVVLAHQESRMLDHNYIGTEHLLLGLLHEGEGVAATALESLGISLEAARQQVEEIIGRGQHTPSGHIPFTPRAKKVLELSLREVQQLGDNHIGTEHILLGLVREGGGVGAQILVKLGTELNQVRRQVIQLLTLPADGARTSTASTEVPAAEATTPLHAGQGERRAIVLAQEEARMLSHDHVGTEHLLLGLLHDSEGGAATALTALGISLAAVRQRILEITGTGEQAPPGPIPFTPRARKALDLSLREAQELGHGYIGTEHILLGLLREGDGVAAQVLVKLGADLNRVRQQVKLSR